MSHFNDFQAFPIRPIEVNGKVLGIIALHDVRTVGSIDQAGYMDSLTFTVYAVKDPIMIKVLHTKFHKPKLVDMNKDVCIYHSHHDLGEGNKLRSRVGYIFRLATELAAAYLREVKSTDAAEKDMQTILK